GQGVAVQGLDEEAGRGEFLEELVEQASTTDQGFHGDTSCAMEKHGPLDGRACYRLIWAFFLAFQEVPAATLPRAISVCTFPGRRQGRRSIQTEFFQPVAHRAEGQPQALGGGGAVPARFLQGLENQGAFDV